VEMMRRKEKAFFSIGEVVFALPPLQLHMHNIGMVYGRYLPLNYFQPLIFFDDIVRRNH
jgi:hypothetical protein